MYQDLINPSHDMDPTLRMNLLDTRGAGYRIADLWTNDQCATIQEILGEAFLELAKACHPRRAFQKAWEWAVAAMEVAQQICARLKVAQRDLTYSPGHKEPADFGLDREPAQDEGNLPSIDLLMPCTRP